MHLLIGDPRQKILGLERIFRQDLAEKFIESLVERAHHPLPEAPEVHGYERVAGELDVILAVGRVGGAVAALFDVRPLGDRGEKAVFRFADAARNIAVFGNGIAYTVADHGVFALRHRLGEKIIERAERPRAVKIVGVDDGEGAVDHAPAGAHGVRRAPRFFAAFGNGEPRRDVVRRLEHIPHVHPALRMTADNGAEIRLAFLFDDEHDLAEARLIRVVQREVHDDLAVIAHGRDLLEPAEAAAHTGGHNDKRRVFHKGFLRESYRVFTLQDPPGYPGGSGFVKGAVREAGTSRFRGRRDGCCPRAAQERPAGRRTGWRPARASGR